MKIQILDSEQIHELTRNCPNSENKVDWYETKWARLTDVVEFIDKCLDTKNKKYDLDNLVTFIVENKRE